MDLPNTAGHKPIPDNQMALEALRWLKRLYFIFYIAGEQISLERGQSPQIIEKDKTKKTPKPKRLKHTVMHVYDR